MKFLIAISAFAALSSAAVVKRADAKQPCGAGGALKLNANGEYGTSGGWKCKSGTPGIDCTGYEWTATLPYYICDWV